MIHLANIETAVRAICDVALVESSEQVKLFIAAWTVVFVDGHYINPIIHAATRNVTASARIAMIAKIRRIVHAVN